MAESLSAQMTSFIDEILAIEPKLAAFDCDGTLWSGDAGESFFWWELDNGLIPEETAKWARARHADYKAGKLSEEDMCADMVTIHKGLEEAPIQRAADKLFEETLLGGIFPEMRTLVERLHANGCEVWAVSSSNQWIIRSAMPHFGIPVERILATEVKVVDGQVTDQLVRVPSGPGKPSAIREVIGRVPEAVFGNSIWDREMLEMSPHPVAVNPTRDLAAMARAKHWMVYFPDGTGRDV